jgi:DNA-binding MarR family transcriptional regulator
MRTVRDQVRPEDVGMRYLSLAHSLRRVVDEHMTAGGLSLARTKVLQVLDRVGPLRQARLAAELGFAARTVSQTIESLEQDGLVHRGPHPDDGRAKLVAITAEGSAALATGTTAGEQLLRWVFGSLDRDSLTNLDELLTVVERGLAEASRRTPPRRRGA